MKERTMLRRTFLRSAGGAVLALPLMTSSRGAIAQDGGGPPKRFAVFFIPNGVVPSMWFPTSARSERDFDLAASMAPLDRHRDRLLVFRGVHLHSHGAGDDHQQGMAAMLTGRPALDPGPGGSFEGGGCGCYAGWASGISIDQRIADHVGASTPLRSIELGVQALSGGLGGAVSVRTRMSYRGASEPLHPIDDPVASFDRLFGGFVPTGTTEPPELERVRRRRQSILDTVLEQHRLVRSRLSNADQVRLERHTEMVRAIERRLEGMRAPMPAACTVPSRPTGLDSFADANIPDITRHQLDLLAHAFACDITRVGSFMFNNSNGNHTMPFGAVASYAAGHELGHSAIDDGRGEAQEFGRRVTWYTEQLAYFLDRLASIDEGAGTVLDNTLVLLVSENATGQHEYRDMPFLLAGNVGGYFDTGRYLQVDSSHNDLLVSVQNAFGVESSVFGSEAHCTGPLAGLRA